MLDRLTPITKHLIIINVIIFAAFMLVPDLKPVENLFFTLHKSNVLELRESVMLDGVEAYPMYKDGAVDYYLSAEMFRPWQIVLSFFNHSKADIFHVLFNMLVLGMFGPLCESVLGSKRFLNFYLFCGVVAGIALAFLDPSPNPVLGASTAVSGVLVAFAMAFPNQRVGLFFLPIFFKAKDFVLGAAAISALLVILQTFGMNVGGISHFGHLAGMVAGFLFFKVEKYLPLPK